MKKLLLLILLCPISLFAQDSLQRKFVVKICPTALFPFPFGAIQPSVEYRFNKHFSGQLEMGYGVFEKTANQLVKPFAWKTNIEARYYFGKHNRPFYVGVNAFYYYLRDNWGVRYFPSYDKTTDIYDRFSFTRSVYGAMIIGGFQFVKKRFVFNPFIGGGISYRDISNSHREYAPSAGDEALGVHHPSSYWSLQSNLSENTGQFQAITLGARIGFAL